MNYRERRVTESIGRGIMDATLEFRAMLSFSDYGALSSTLSAIESIRIDMKLSHELHMGHFAIDAQE